MHLWAPRYISTRPSSRRGFTLVELLVVVSLIAVFAFFTVPVVHGLSKAGRRYASVTKLARALEQARSYSLASGTRSRVAFCDSLEAGGRYRLRSYAIFEEDPELETSLIRGQWHLLDEGCIFRNEQDDLLAPGRARADFQFLPEGKTLSLPYIEFDELGRVTEPRNADHCSVDIVEGFLTNNTLQTMGETSSHRLTIARSTGRVRTSEVIDSQKLE